MKFDVLNSYDVMEQLVQNEKWVQVGESLIPLFRHVPTGITVCQHDIMFPQFIRGISPEDIELLIDKVKPKTWPSELKVPGQELNEFTYSRDQVIELRAIFDRRIEEKCEVPYQTTLFEFGDEDHALEWLGILERCNRYPSAQAYWDSFSPKPLPSDE